MLFQLVQRFTYRNRKPIVFYEKVAMQSDIVHIQYVMNQRNYRFAINSVGASTAKGQRIDALEPIFRKRRVWLCEDAWHYNWEGAREDMMTSFIQQEYIPYPFCAHDDALDSLSRIADTETGSQMVFPDPVSVEYQIRSMLEGRGLKFENITYVEYEPI